MRVPGFWMNETSGVLRPAIVAYLEGAPMTPEQIAAMRAYLRQWIMADWPPGPGLQLLRHGIEGLTSRAALGAWVHQALMLGIDPL